MYLLELFLYAVRATTNCELGTTLYASGPGYMPHEDIQKGVLKKKPYQIEDFSKVHLDAAVVEIGIPSRVVDQFREFTLSHF